jgi:C4-dicarboxylate-binding protein DctP
MTTPTGMAGSFLKDYLEKQSNGSVTMEIFSDGQLYKDDTEVDALISGNIDMISP